MKSTQQRMEACMDRDDNIHTHTPSSPPPPHPPTHTPVTTANPRPCHNREKSHTAISIPSSVHITQLGKDKKPLQSITAHCTALSSHHWHLGERLAEGGCAHRNFLSNSSARLVLYCGHLPVVHRSAGSREQPWQEGGQEDGGDYCQWQH